MGKNSVQDIKKTVHFLREFDIYGGVKLFRILRPVFLGFVLGRYSAAGLWFVIDLITRHTGNCVFWI